MNEIVKMIAAKSSSSATKKHKKPTQTYKEERPYSPPLSYSHTKEQNQLIDTHIAYEAKLIQRAIQQSLYQCEDIPLYQETPKIKEALEKVYAMSRHVEDVLLNHVNFQGETDHGLSYTKKLKRIQEEKRHQILLRIQNNGA